MKFCIVIGHNRINQGAKYGNYSEYIYNTHLAEDISCILSLKGHTGIIISKDGLTEETVSRIINNQNPRCSVELHCNAFNEKASGSEVLYIEKNPESSILSFLMQASICRNLKRTIKQDRGIKELKKRSRGYKNLTGIKCPSCIVEPFFIDNRKEILMAVEKMKIIANAIVEGLLLFADND